MIPRSPPPVDRVRPERASPSLLSSWPPPPQRSAPPRDHLTHTHHKTREETDEIQQTGNEGHTPYLSIKNNQSIDTRHITTHTNNTTRFEKKALRWSECTADFTCRNLLVIRISLRCLFSRGLDVKELFQSFSFLVELFLSSFLLVFRNKPKCSS